MNKIVIDREELIKIKKDLERSKKNWDPLLNSIEPCLREEDWELIHMIEGPLLKAVREIDRLLLSARIVSSRSR